MTTSHEIEVYVRFCETDAAGHVNNTSYFFYLEEARLKYFDTLGIVEDERLNFILASTTCDYVAQAYAGQTLKVSTNVSKIGVKSFSVNHVITEADTGKEIAKGSAALVCFNYFEQRTKSIPASLRDNLESKIVKSTI
ncbi:acyl-CoA thioesterase [Virgibacillus salinus]|uniref:Acyl-CoA thioester hydrolase n=1 Tax=Virgibacillus salinus TaxID=553311 RepID=A0A1H1ET32_9BACI|nr:thioesterase family protein [Virgibacillus salinus]SDQ91276.1 acyl-CoA thioester hydrolase [Virgibacillus salinus]